MRKGSGMFKFLFQVVVSIVVMSALVWFGLPILKEKMPSIYGRIAVKISGQTVSQVVDEVKNSPVAEQVEKAADVVGENAQALLGKVAEISGTGASQESQSAETPESQVVRFGVGEDKTQETNSLAQTEGAGVVDGLAASETTDPAVVDIPVEDPAAALNKDPGYNWGIVVTNSFFYDADMNVAGILAGGTVVERKSSQLMEKGNLATCYYLIGQQWKDETVNLYESDLVLFEVPYEKALKKDRDLLVEYCKLLGRQVELKGIAYKEALRRNPYLEEFKAVSAEYKDFAKKARQANEEYKSASGSKRMALMDQLRKFKADEADLSRRYEDVKKKYDAWKDENLVPERIPKTIDIQLIENKLTNMRAAVQEIVPGL